MRPEPFNDRSRSSYFTNRPLAALPRADEPASRSWLHCDRYPYHAGDFIAVCGNELNIIARPMYEFVTKTKHALQSDQQLSKKDQIQEDATDSKFEKLVQEFTVNIHAYSAYWTELGSQCKFEASLFLCIRPDQDFRQVF